MDTPKVGRSKRAAKRLDWINRLPEVGHPIEHRVLEIQRQEQEVKTQQLILAEMRKDLLEEVNRLWTTAEIIKAGG